MGLTQYFIGPMAKQHRMAVMTVACLLSTVEPLFGYHGLVVRLALAIIICGAVVTLIRRTLRVVNDLKQR